MDNKGMKKNNIGVKYNRKNTRSNGSYISHPIGVNKPNISAQKSPRGEYTQIHRSKPIIVDVKLKRTYSNLQDILSQNGKDIENTPLPQKLHDKKEYDTEPIDENESTYNDLRTRLHSLISDDTDELSENILGEQQISTPHTIKPLLTSGNSIDESYHFPGSYSDVHVDHNGFISFAISDIMMNDMYTPILFTVMSRIHSMCMLFRVWSLQKQYYDNTPHFNYRCESINTYEISWAIQCYILKLHMRGHRCVMLDYNYYLYIDKHTLVLMIKRALTRTLLTRQNARWVFSMIAKKIFTEWV
jgi:hypothetical protein